VAISNYYDVKDKDSFPAQAIVLHFNNGRLKSFAPRFCLWILCAASFQLSAHTLKQVLNDLPLINVDIASMDFPPNAYTTANGRVSGKAIETIRALCIIARMKCDVIIYPTARAYMSIENSSSDVLLTANLPELELCCTYTEWSYPFLAGLITHLAIGAIPVDEITLKGHSLVMVRGWKSIYDVYPNLKDLVAAGEVELIETSSIASAIKIYNAGRTSLLWGANVFEWYFDKLSLEWKDEHFRPLVESSAGIWISKQSEHHEDILIRFNLAYQLLKEQGDLDNENFLVPSLKKQVYIETSKPH
jgi:hypothetical protein